MSESRVTVDVATTLPNDDCVITFRTEISKIRGRLVRLGAAADTILSRHKLPPPVSVALGEALALTSLYGSALPPHGKLILQTRTEGPVSLMVADVASNAGASALRGYARFDAEAIARLDTRHVSAVDVIGSGSMAVTVDQGADDRYQAITAIEGVSLAEASARYFEDREGAPALVRLAVAPLYIGPRKSEAATTQWRCGGLMMQQAANAAPLGDEDGWNRVRTLAETVEPHELVDPMLSSERLLLRLFHEEGVRIEKVTRVTAQCRCSRERILDVLKSFGHNELADMPDAEGRITVTCEFCATPYVFEAADIL